MNIHDDISLLRITWLDATSVARWTYLQEAETLQPVTCISIGYLLNETPIFYALASSVIQENEMLSEIIIIPKGMVVLVEELSTVAIKKVKAKQNVKSKKTTTASKKIKQASNK